METTKDRASVDAVIRGRRVILTVQAEDPKALLGRLDALLDYLDVHAPVVAAPVAVAPPVAQFAPQPAAAVALGPLCPAHGVPMKPSKQGPGFYCTQKDVTTGQYCQVKT